MPCGFQISRISDFNKLVLAFRHLFLASRRLLSIEVLNINALEI
jgi:hypothetical protein